jgi:peptidyl-prolyl cis-trans isomerase C
VITTRNVSARLLVGLSLLIFSLGTFTTGCTSEDREGPIVARVGDAALTVVQLKNQIPDSELADEQRRLFVDSWVRRQLLYQEAVAREVDRTPRMRQLVEQARRDLVIAAFVDDLFDDQQIEVNESDVEQYYHLHADEFRRVNAEIRAQHILLGSRRDATALHSELLRGAVFEEKVRELSIDRETNTVGGDLGYFTADDRSEIWEACDGTSAGQLCRNVTLEGGYHIVRLTDRKESGSVRDLAEPAVRERILEALVREKHRERIDELVSSLREQHTWSVDETRLATQ